MSDKNCLLEKFKILIDNAIQIGHFKIVAVDLHTQILRDMTKIRNGLENRPVYGLEGTSLKMLFAIETLLKRIEQITTTLNKHLSV